MNVVDTFWIYARTLRKEGMSFFGDYVEQLSYLLFLKLADEQGTTLPDKCDWQYLRKLNGKELLKSYSNALLTLGESSNFNIAFSGANTQKFEKPVSLKNLIEKIDKIDWSSMNTDIKAELYEGLLEKFHSSEKGQGQYFTPRPVILTIIDCIQPKFKLGIQIHDPASGTGGFLINTFEYFRTISDGFTKLNRTQTDHLMKNTFSGVEIESRVRKLAYMNSLLRGLDVNIDRADSLSDTYNTPNKFDYILTNPPFGGKTSDGNNLRDDFSVVASELELNFLQHVMTILKNGGECAIVMPDGALSSPKGRRIFEKLFKKFNLHTMIRLQSKTFMPYADAETNVLFFKKGEPTKDIWIYDNRTNYDPITKRQNKLTEEMFDDFKKCYKTEPRKASERFKKVLLSEIENNENFLDYVWIDDKNKIDYSTINPVNVSEELSDTLKTAIQNIKNIQKEL